ncbi:MAG: alpha/beta fold hydrolase [Acidimicrobiia bacterium]
MQAGTQRWFDVDGALVHAMQWGDRAKNRQVLLVHGLGASTLSWMPIGARLATALDATVTAVDLPGFGLTRLPPGRTAGLSENGRVVRDLLGHYLGPATVVGNSMGGALGVGLAARHPELVASLVLVDPALPSRGAPPWRLMARFAPLMMPALGQRFIGYRARTLGPAGLVDSTLEWSIARPERLDPALRTQMVELATARLAFPEAGPAYADAARALFFYLQGRMPADLARVQCPTLIVHGELDRLVPVAAARAAAARRPDFTLQVIHDCGHAPQIELPDPFLEVVTPWLTTQPEGVGRG